MLSTLTDQPRRIVTRGAEVELTAYWIKTEQVARPTEAGRITLSSSVWVIQARAWLPVSTLDVAELIPYEEPELVRRSRPDWWPAWYDQARCQGMEEDERNLLFFGADDNPHITLVSTTVKKARAMCAACPVVRDCLEHALTKPEGFGIWGGTTGRQRRELRARLRAGGELGQVVDTVLEELCDGTRAGT